MKFKKLYLKVFFKYENEDCYRYLYYYNFCFNISSAFGRYLTFQKIENVDCYYFIIYKNLFHKKYSHLE